MIRYYLFDSAEHYMDCLCGYHNRPTIIFHNEAIADLWLRQFARMQRSGQPVYCCTADEFNSQQREYLNQAA